MKIYSICCTYNRHKLLERSVGCFLKQEYVGEHKLLIYNNSPYKLRMDKEYENIILFNNNIDIMTKKPYSNTGPIFRDAFSFVPKSVDIVQFWDDDDMFKENHISAGVKGIVEALDKGMVAYKPKHSLFRYAKEPERLSNNLMEPSIFVLRDWVEKHGFNDHSSGFHSNWTAPLFTQKQIYIKEDGEPTFIYDWSDEAKAHKISGDGHNKDNFKNHQNKSTDIGNGIIKPLI